MTVANTRLASVDATRGLIMLFMAIDHVVALVARHHSAEYWGGTWTRYADGDTTQFVLRFLSDLCAPGFFLWMGVGIAFLTAQRTRAGQPMPQVTQFLVLRGLALIVIGQVIETPAWLIGILSSAVHGRLAEPIPGGGGPLFAALGVLFALGAAMVVTSLLMPLLGKRPGWWIALGAAVLIACSAAIPPETHAREVFSWWQRVLLVAGQGGVVLFEYPVAPWFGITCLGVGLGQQLDTLSGESKRFVRVSLAVGVLLVLGAVALRLLGSFGNTRLPRDNSWIEFFNLIKYPPSLVFTMMMVGANLLLFSLFSRFTNSATRALQVFGQAPLLFYIVHLYLFAIVGAVFFRHGASFPVALCVWALGLVALYPACAAFQRFKARRPATSWWRIL